MDKKILILLIAGIFTACSSSSGDVEQIDYSALETLQYSVVLEINESENFLPGRLRDVVVTSDSSILVSDWASNSITQFDSSGNFIATIAESGNGPGELSQYFRIQGMRNDTLMVKQQVGQRDYFAKGSNGEYQFVRSSVPEETASRQKEILGHKTDTTYFAQTTRSFENMQQALKNEKDYRNSVLVETNLSGKVLEDSLLLLKKGTRHVSKSGNAFRIQAIPYRYDDQFVLLSDGFLIARPDSNALFFYNTDSQLQRRTPFNVKARPVTDEDLDRLFEDTDDNIRNPLEARIDEEKPPYLDIWATKNHLWLKTTISENGNQIVVVDFEGKPIGKLTLSNLDEIQTVSGNNIYTIYKDPEKGNTIRKYKIKI